MDSQNFKFIPFQENNILEYLSERKGETKLGSTLCSSIQEARYIIIGIEESVGPRANFGREGAENAFDSFLSSFINMQSNVTLTGEDTFILGKIVCKGEITEDLRNKVEELDDFLVSILNHFVLENQIPIVIGGGHNNALPLIRFSSERYNQKINVVNLDAHADYRWLEGRHSGNSFSYGYKNGWIERYFVFGLHPRYNSQQILDDLENDEHFYTFNEDYLFGGREYLRDFKNMSNQLNESGEYLGIELDLDTIERMPSSAYSPVGVSISTARQYLHFFGKIKNVTYLHLPEGAPQNDIEKRIVGKTLAYLVSDFIISHGS